MESVVKCDRSRAMHWSSYKLCLNLDYITSTSPVYHFNSLWNRARSQIPVKFSWGGPRFEILVVISYL